MNTNKSNRIAGIALNLITVVAMLALALGVPTTVFAAQPANDVFANAIAITSSPSTQTMSEIDFNDAINGVGDPNVCGFGNPGVHTIWYSFTPASYGKATIDTYGSSFDTILAVWTGSFGYLQEVACSDDTNTGVQSELKISLKPGLTYYIEVIQYTSSATPQTNQMEAVQPSTPTDYMTLNFSFSQVPNVAAPGVYDDKASFFTYTGSWANISATGAYKGSYKISKVVGNSASINFYGVQFKLYYTRLSSNGFLQMFLDGATTSFNDLNESGTNALQQVYTSPLVSSGIHTLQLKDGYKYVTIDAIEIVAPPDVMPPAQITDLAAVAGATYGTVALSWTAVGNDGMTGTASAYDVRYSLNPIDDTNFASATQITSGVPVPKTVGSAETMSVTLVPGLTYYFAVRALDSVPTDLTPGPASNSPSVTAPFSTVSASGTYGDEKTTNWMYSGTWSQLFSAAATDAKYRYSPKIGNSAALVFNGSGFTFTYVQTSSGGVADIRVDGVSVKQINMKALVTKFKVTYTLTGLTPGQHTFQIIHLSGSRVYVDGITILP